MRLPTGDGRALEIAEALNKQNPISGFRSGLHYSSTRSAIPSS